jgi:hypothetical protein
VQEAALDHQAFKGQYTFNQIKTIFSETSDYPLQDLQIDVPGHGFSTTVFTSYLVPYMDIIVKKSNLSPLESALLTVFPYITSEICNRIHCINITADPSSMNYRLTVEFTHVDTHLLNKIKNMKRDAYECQ